MIELNKKTQQDFLNRGWVQRLLDVGVDMSDAKYLIVTIPKTGKDYIILSTRLHEREDWLDKVTNTASTYTASELLYKLHECLDKFASICGSIDIMSYSSFACSVDEDNCHEILFHIHSGRFQSYIEQLASLLIQCHQKDIGIKSKDTGDIKDK